MTATNFGSGIVLVLLSVLLGGCSGSTTIATETIPGVDCHFATTVPGGELPQPQCETPPETTDSTDPQPPTNPWECPAAEDYPITVAATSWQPFTTPPDPIPSCGGNLLDAGAPDILIPTKEVEGLSGDSSIGIAAYRQPGGIFWSTKVALPATDPLIVVKAASIIESYPDPDEWRNEQLERMCGSASESLVIRESEGCRNASTYGWVTDDTAYTLTVDLDLSTDIVLQWLETWRVAS